MKKPWFERPFSFHLAAEDFPLILERVRGTPARLEERLAGLSREVRTRRRAEAWSIQENAGHLSDLEPLWLGRVADVLEGREVMRPADLTNRKTHQAGHNERPVAEVLEEFRRRRGEFVSRLEGLDEAQVLEGARHPRLEQTMRILDLAFFVAEYDDHHLATITELLRG